jgi:CTP:molybdopterin cytidylyltransferase MocA
VSRVAGLLLAAGAGRRLGGPKAVLDLAGERLVDRGVRLLRDGGCKPVIVVSGATPLGDVDADVVPNPEWATGMGSSLRAGLAALEGTDVTGVVVALVDHPLVGSEAVRRLAAAHAAGSLVAVATYGGQRGNPVLLGRSTWTEVAAVAMGDIGARPFLVGHPELVTPVPCDHTGAPDDVDTAEDLARIRSQLGG